MGHRGGKKAATKQTGEITAKVEQTRLILMMNLISPRLSWAGNIGAQSWRFPNWYTIKCTDAYGGDCFRLLTPPPPPLPLENHKNLVCYFSNTGLDPPGKSQSQPSLSRYHWPASQTPFKWCFAGGHFLTLFRLGLNLIKIYNSMFSGTLSECQTV